MTWTMTNLVIEIIAGIAGAHIVANAAREYSFGALGRSVVGAIGGYVGGYFFDAAMVVNGSNALYQSRLLDQAMAHSLTAAATGGILILAISFVAGDRLSSRANLLSAVTDSTSSQPSAADADSRVLDRDGASRAIDDGYPSDDGYQSQVSTGHGRELAA
jgi:uncharacterized membrane protein YeaQ/YmgE (transglycosylase-associated protein family)